MDMSNSLITTGFQTPLVTPANQAEKQARLPLPNSTENQSSNTNQTRSERSSRTKDSTTVNQVEFIKKGEALQSERYLRQNSLENAPLKGQQALNSYQQTIDAARQFEEGELVGIDLYI